MMMFYLVEIYEVDRDVFITALNYGLYNNALAANQTPTNCLGSSDASATETKNDWNIN